MPTDPITAALAQSQRSTRDQVNALWQVQMDHIRDLLSHEWQDRISRVVDERFADLAPIIRSRVDEEMDVRLTGARSELMHHLGEHLNACFRRMRQYESDRHWCDALLDAVEAFCGRAVFFSVRGQELSFQGYRGSGMEGRPAPPDVPLQAAPAFAAVVSSAQPHEPVRSAAVLSDPIAELTGEAPEATALLLPVLVTERVAGVLYVEDPAHSSALEAVVNFAGCALENHLATIEHSRPSTSVRPAAEVERLVLPPPKWIDLPKSEQRVHLEAQRFARVQFARLLLHRPAEVEEGRERRDLYGTFQPEIDAARQEFRTRFLEAAPSMVDYLHVELLRTLGNDDPGLLGNDYPGPLV